MIKNILVHMNSDARRGVRLEVATALAQQHDARLTALYPLDRPYYPAVAEFPVDASVFEEYFREMKRKAEVVRREFDEATRRRGVAAEWRCEEDYAVALLIRQARYADLVVLPQGRESSDVPDQFLCGEVLMGAGRPILIVPYAGDFQSVGRRVVVAWNGSREATRAVHDALPILKRAESVTVLSINSTDARHIPGSDICAHLAAHGVKATAEVTRAADIEVGDVLLNAVANEGADLLVMGAYGHSRIRELMLGGTSRHILAHMTTPVLMSH